MERIRAYFSPSQATKEERRLVQKIDFFILTFCCLSYFCNYLDRSNLTNAYVSGMQEDLSFKGNQLTQINTIFTCGYIIGQIPSNLALYYIRPRVFFPSMMVIWGALTMITSSARRPEHIMAIRFFQGIAESTTFVGTHYILGSWYTARELGKRSGIFTASGLAGTMFGGFIQSGIQRSLHNTRGLTGWRWLFIVDGLITMPVALYGFLLFPNTPSTTTAPYLSARERALAVARVPEVRERAPLSLAFARRVLTSFYFYGFVVLWIIAGETESFSSNALLALYMKAHPTVKYTVAQLNDYPTGVPAVGIVATLFWATLTDFLGGKRYLVGYWIGITGVVTSVLILTRFEDTATVFGAYYWAGSVYACQATFFAWANDALRYEEDMLRAVVVAAMNMGSNIFNAWWSIVFYSADFAPRFTRGMWAMIGCSIALAIWTTVLLYWTLQMEKRVVHGGGISTFPDSEQKQTTSVSHIDEGRQRFNRFFGGGHRRRR
ncbi:MFS general substrate transporter [Auricularia subglabra TFB-10046 SS5]|nr:MFS general substrate transporter [Auricularia subglabra TFB-10046 SS5]